jgi:hypothetical protein
MVNKRKKTNEDEAPTLTRNIHMQKVNSDGPFAVYFPSGFDPTKSEAQCEMQMYEHSTRKNQYAVVAKTVSFVVDECFHFPTRLFSVHATCVLTLHCLRPILNDRLDASLMVQGHDVDFVGSTANKDYTTTTPCK